MRAKPLKTSSPLPPFYFESERATWKPPLLAVSSAAEARPGYNTMTASEFVEEEVVLRAKVRRLAALLRGAKRPVFYCGAGLSTSAGISDYASQKGESLTSQAQPALQESLQRALGRTLVCAVCSGLVHAEAARRQANARGSASFAAGDGCASATCTTSHAQPARYRASQAKMAQALLGFQQRRPCRL